MNVGFTGTRWGMTLEQRNLLSKMFDVLDPHEDVFRHGDCVGADAEAAELAAAHGLYVIVHPPVDGSLRAFMPAPQVMPPRPYLARNRDIVNNSDQLWACPSGGPQGVEGLSGAGGTWYTIRDAVSQHKPTGIVYPDGSMEWR